MHSPAAASSSRPKRCSGPARSSFAAPITSCLRSPPTCDAAASWLFRPATTPKAWRQQRSSSTCRPSSSCRATRGAVLVPPYDDPFVIAGQGTTGREIAEDVAHLGRTLDCVIVNASGGGLTAGIALAVKARAPGARIYTAEPEGFDDHARSFRSGRRERNAVLTGSMCDALMSQMPGELTFEVNRTLVAAGVTATEAEVARAVSFAFHELKLVVEPGGAVALAALLAGKLDIVGKTAVVVLSGGNIDPELFARLVA